MFIALAITFSGSTGTEHNGYESQECETEQQLFHVKKIYCAGVRTHGSTNNVKEIPEENGG